MKAVRGALVDGAGFSTAAEPSPIVDMHPM